MKKIVVVMVYLALSACVTKANPAKTEVYYPGVGTLEYKCPPGQRKNGRCL